MTSSVNRTAVVLIVCAYWLTATVQIARAAAEKQRAGRPPNIVLILADDLGWAELGCYGNTFNHTPHLDRLADHGLRFTQAYAAAPVCSPFRAALMTGQFPARVGITDYLRPNDPQHLATDYVTLAEMLKSAGYATGMLGKWHLTGYTHHGAVEVPPTAHGFDDLRISETRGIGGGSYFHPYHFNPAIERRLGGEREFLVDRMNLEAVEFVERHQDERFFLYKSHYAVHTRLDGRPDLVAKYAARPDAGKGPRAKQNNPHLAAQLESIDEGVGMLVKKLAELDLLDDTIVIFMSDNGGESRVTRNGPLRAGKSTLYEGGIRVPLIIRWPGRLTPGSVCDEPVTNLDLYPTLAEAAGATLPMGHRLDGTSLMPLLADPQARLDRDALYWHYPLEKPHFLGGVSSGAIRAREWKLIEEFTTGRLHLFNLEKDVGETTDLSDAHPEVARRLRTRLADWRLAVGAKVTKHQGR